MRAGSGKRVQERVRGRTRIGDKGVGRSQFERVRPALKGVVEQEDERCQDEVGSDGRRGVGGWGRGGKGKGSEGKGREAKMRGKEDVSFVPDTERKAPNRTTRREHDDKPSQNQNSKPPKLTATRRAPHTSDATARIQAFQSPTFVEFRKRLEEPGPGRSGLTRRRFGAELFFCLHRGFHRVRLRASGERAGHVNIRRRDRRGSSALFVPTGKRTIL